MKRYIVTEKWINEKLMDACCCCHYSDTVTKLLEEATQIPEWATHFACPGHLGIMEAIPE